MSSVQPVVKRIDVRPNDLAIVNRTGLSITAEGGGYSAVLNGGDISATSRFPCIQSVPEFAARKMYDQKYHFLEMMEIAVAEQLLALARLRVAEHGDNAFFVAYEEMFGYPPDRSGEHRVLAQELAQLRSILRTRGYIATGEETLEQLRRMVTEPERRATVKTVSDLKVAPTAAAVDETIRKAREIAASRPAVEAAKKSATDELTQLRQESVQLGIGFSPAMKVESLKQRKANFLLGDFVQRFIQSDENGSWKKSGFVNANGDFKPDEKGAQEG